MKTTIFKLIICFLMLFIFSYRAVGAGLETYRLDPTHTYVLWRINHFGFSYPSGKWMVAEGTVKLDQAKPQNSSVNAVIHVADVVTGIPELDDHLKKQVFFDVAKFPLAAFVSDKVIVTGKDSAKVHGILSLHGVSRPITLMVKLNKIGINPITNKDSVGFSATTTLKRSDFGMGTLLPGLGDEVKINIEAEGHK